MRAHIISMCFVSIALVLGGRAEASVTLLWESPEVPPMYLKGPVLEINPCEGIHYLYVRDNVAETITFYDADDFSQVAVHSDQSSLLEGLYLVRINDMNGNGNSEILADYGDYIVIADIITGTVLALWDDSDGIATYDLVFVGRTQGSNEVKLMIRRYDADPPSSSKLLVYTLETPVSSVEGTPDGSPVSLSQSWPNPFTSGTTIEYRLDKPGNVQLRILDAAGRLVRATGTMTVGAGPHEYYWDGTSASGVAVSSGTYFYELCVNGKSEAKKMVVVR